MPTGTNIGANQARTYNWTRPAAIKVGNDTYYTGVGESGSWYCSKNSSANRVQIYPGSDQDDHNHPSVVQVDDKIFCFFTRHGQSGLVNYVSCDVGNTNFGTKQALTFSSGSVSYSQPVCVGDDVWVFTRNGARYWSFMHSGDKCVNWDSEIDLIDGGSGNKIYMTQSPSSTAGVYHVAVYGHPSESNLTDIYYFKINFNNGDVLDIADNVIANLDGTNLPLTITNLDVAWTPSGANNPRIRLHDVGEKYGNPMILYGKWNDVTATPQHYYGYFDGTSWVHTKLETSGAVFFNSGRKYEGGASFSQNGDNYLYLGMYDTGDDLWKIRKWLINSDMTATYASSPDSSSAILCRPICPVGGSGVMYVQFTSYTSYLNFESNLYWKT